MPRANQSNIAATRWTIRIIPCFLLAAAGFATYVVPAHLCGTQALDATTLCIRH